MGLQTGGQVAGALAGAHDGPVRRQDLGAGGTRVLELLLLQGAVQVAADAAQLSGDGSLAEVRAHRLRARGAVRVSWRVCPALRAPSRPAPPRPGAHVHDVQLGQQAAVGQRELIAVQKAAAGLAQLRLAPQLVLQGRAQVAVQLGEGAQQLLVQS